MSVVLEKYLEGFSPHFFMCLLRQHGVDADLAKEITERFLDGQRLELRITEPEWFARKASALAVLLTVKVESAT